MRNISVGKSMKPHGIMFHHFWNGNHPKGQGAISGDEFENMLHFVGLKNILSAQEFQNKVVLGKLKKNEICLTFDDNLRCQFDVAYPILKKYGLTAFWFVYSSPLIGIDEKLEVYRYYRTVFFESIDNFYKYFFDYLSETGFGKLVNDGLKVFSPEKYLKEHSFYSNNDRKFRFIRDRILKEKYFEVMDDILKKDSKYRVSKIRERLWMDMDCIRRLDLEGHVIGLHSHTHPTDLGGMSYIIQKVEYEKNYDILWEILNKKPKSVSYPSNSYNEDTLKIMKGLKITIGFKADMNSDSSNLLTFPRNDHAYILKEMKS